MCNLDAGRSPGGIDEPAADDATGVRTAVSFCKEMCTQHALADGVHMIAGCCGEPHSTGIE
jgi:hypothetical protein